KSFGGAEEESVYIAGQFEVVCRSANLEDAAAFSVVRPVSRHPDGLDEEVLGDERRQDVLRLLHAALRIAEMAEPEARALGVVAELDVVLEHEALRHRRRVLRLVTVAAARQREEIGHPLHQARAALV